ncbi:hypothetical protein MF271_04795 [Deinococcus sp. KNUC1210]|uniref:hypothetical protein n=1 Tax=Deinococcus sp. KNUC1210 TaxID=2917691 RepID=UPI001EEFFD4D|nr:hypothetical protein [Deinococcus sp. KNUC1210]ULH15952.1 hypothetical protein MF271_04795 [Deinococcus sp. KNUC1210]
MYGLTRAAASGPEGRALLVRTDFDSFGRASGSLGFEQQFQRLLQLSQARQPGELTIWSETAIINAPDLLRAPAPGIYGVYSSSGEIPPRAGTVPRPAAWSIPSSSRCRSESFFRSRGR